MLSLGLLPGVLCAGLLLSTDAGAAPGRTPRARLIQAAKPKKITFPPKPWVDVNFDKGNGKDSGSWNVNGTSDLSGLLGAALGVKNGANGNGGNGAGNGGRGTGKPPGSTKPGGDEKNQIGFDDSQAKDQGNGNYAGDAAGGGGAGGGGGGGNGSQAFAKWWPMCLFIGDHESSATGNATVKELIDDAAACKVNLVVFPITVPAGSIPSDPNAANAMQIASCNIQQGLGVNKGSTSTCTPHPLIAAQMCDKKLPPPRDNEWDPAVAGCAQVASGSAAKIDNLLKQAYPNWNQPGRDNGADKAAYDKRKAEIQDHGSGGEGSGILPSLEKIGACDGTTVGHEAQGHSQFGYPNGASSGKAIGITDKGGGGSGWTKEGCDQMVATALPNDGRWRWNPNQQTYYVKASPERLFKLGTDKVFRPPGPMLADGGAGGMPDGPTRLGFDDAVPKVREVPPVQGGINPPVIPVGKANLATAFDDERHKPKPQSLLLIGASGGQNTYQAEAPGETISSINPQPRKFPPPARGDPANKIGFDDEAPKGFISSSGKTGPPPPSAKNGAPGPGEQYGPAESTDFSTGSVTSSATFSTGSGGKGSSVGYDDNAPKGFAGNGSSINLGNGGRGPASAAGRPLEESVSGASGGKILAGGAGGSNPLDSGFFKALSGDDDEEELERRKKRQPGGALRLRPSDGVARGNREPRRAEGTTRGREDP